MQVRLLALLIGLFASFVSSTYIKNEDGFLYLTEENFDEALRIYDYVMVYFYHEHRCHFCPQLEVEMKEAASHL